MTQWSQDGTWWIRWRNLLVRIFGEGWWRGQFSQDPEQREYEMRHRQAAAKVGEDIEKLYKGQKAIVTTLVPGSEFIYATLEYGTGSGTIEENISPWAVAGLVPLGKVLKGGVGAGRIGVKHWLQNAGNLSRSTLIKNIESAGFKRMSPKNSPVSVFERKGMRIRLDPPQPGTPFNHMHLEYGGSSYNIQLNPVNYKSPAAHIPIR